MSFNWKETLATVAPMLASAVGSPIAGLAVSAGLAALGIEPEQGNEEKQLAKAMQNATPEDLLKIKQAENQFKLDMEKVGVDLERLNQEGLKSARKMQIDTHSWVVPVLAMFTVGGFFAVVGLIMTGKVPLDSTLTGFVLGAVSSKAEQVYNFFFGSSKGSKDKTAHLAAK